MAAMGHGRATFDEKRAPEQALDVFWRQGYGATSMADLAIATCVQRGSLHNTYSDKEALFLRVFKDYKDAFLADAAAARAP